MCSVMKYWLDMLRKWIHMQTLRLLCSCYYNDTDSLLRTVIYWTDFLTITSSDVVGDVLV